MADRSLRIKILANTDSYKAEMERASRLGSNYFKTTANSSKRLTTNINQNTAAFSGLNKNIQIATNTLKSFAFPVLGGLAVGNVIKVADSYGQMSARIKMALQSVEGDISSYSKIQERLLEVSNRNAKDLADSQELYIKSADSMKTLGYTTEQTLDFIESLSSAFTANATSSDLVQSSINALNKSFVQGKVSSQQWQTLASAMPNLASQIASALGETTKDIEKQGMAGQLSMRKLANGTIKAKDAFNALAKSMDNTVADGLQQLTNSFTHWAGEMNQSYRVTANLASGLTYLADNFDLVTKAGTVLIGIPMARYIGNVTSAIKESTLRTAERIKTEAADALAKQQLAERELHLIEVEKTGIIQTRRSLEARAALAKTMTSQMHIKQAMMKIDAQEIALNQREIIAKNTLAVATKNASMAAVSFNKAKTMLLGAFGGPVGLIMSLGIAATSFIDFGSSVDDAKQPIEELQLPLDQLIRKFNQVDSARKNVITTGLKDGIKSAAKEVKNDLGDIKTALTDALTTKEMDYEGRQWDFISPSATNAIKAYITEVSDLSDKVKTGEINAHDFGNAIDEAGQKLKAATNGDEGLADAIGRATKGLLNNVGILDETIQKYKGVLGDTGDLPLDTTLFDKQKERLEGLIRNTKLVTEYDKLHYELTSGSLTELLPQQQTELENLAKKLDLIKEQTKLEKERESLAKQGLAFATQEVYNGKSPLEQIDITEQEKLKKLEEWRATGLANEQIYQEAITAVQKEAIEKRKQLDDEAAAAKLANTQAILSSTSSLFDGMAGLVSNFSDESNAAYKALFAVSKGFAIADAALNMQMAISRASTLEPPANYAAMAEAAAMGGQIASTISSLTYGGGREHGGNTLFGRYYQVGEKGKFELYQQDGKQYLIPGNNGRVISNSDLGLSNISLKQGGSSSVINVNQNITFEGNQSDEEAAKKTAMAFKQVIRSALQEEQRPGGLLNRR